MKVSIDKEECIGCELCADQCPDIFEMDEEVAIVKKQPDSAEEECVTLAEDACPTNAISHE